MTTFATSLLCRRISAFIASFAIVFPIAASAEKGAGLLSRLVPFDGGDASLTFAMPTERLQPLLDGGSARGLADFSLGVYTERAFGRLFGTAVPWREAHADDSSLMLDILGFEAGPLRAKDAGDKRVEIRIPIGGYLPFRWNRNSSGLYQISRLYVGAGALLDAGFFRIDAQARYIWAFFGPGEAKIGGVSKTLDPSSYWHASARAEVDLLGLVSPVGEVGMFGFSGPTIETGPLKKNFEGRQISHASFGLSVSPLPRSLSVHAKWHRLLSESDDPLVEHATGRRAILELIEGYSLSVIARF